MKKVLVLGLICLFIFVCCKSPADPEIGKILNSSNSTQDSTQVKFRIEMSTDVSDIDIPPPNGYYWFITAEIYVNGGFAEEIKNTTIIVDGKVAVEFVPKYAFEAGEKYMIKFRFKDTDIPSEWQKTIGFRFYAKLNAVDSTFIVGTGSCYYMGYQWQSDTGYFLGWKVGDWKDDGSFTVSRNN